MSTTRQAPCTGCSGSTPLEANGPFDVHSASKSTLFPFLRLILLSLVGMAEVLVVSFLFDGEGYALRNTSSWTAPWLGHLREIGRVLTAAGTAWVLLGWSALSAVLKRSAVLQSQSIGWLVAHLSCFAAFAGISRAVFAMDQSNSSPISHATWMVVWLILGLSTVLTLAANAWPFPVWVSLLLESRWAMFFAISTGLVAWICGELAAQGWGPLASGTMTLVEVFLNCFYDDLFIDRSQLAVGTSRFYVTIAPQCSGYEGMGLIGVFLLVFTVAFRHRLRFPQALVLFPVGFAVIWILNAARIAGLIAIGTSWSPEIALGGFHSQGGWLVFNLVALCLVVVGTRLEFFVRHPKDALPVGLAETKCNETNVTASYLAPFLAAITVGMVLGALSSNAGADSFSLQVLRIGAALAALVAFKRGLSDSRWSFSWPSVVLGAGVYLVWIGILRFGDSTFRPSPFDTALSPLTMAAYVALSFFSYVVVTPVIEEMAFRGFVLRRIVSADFQHAKLSPLPWVGITISAVLFGALHGSNWLSGIFAGLAYGIAFTRTGSLGDAIAAHATTNGLLAAHAMITGNWAAWT